jgi:NAD(P)-dependent dehydrogenase (short-subunit alcohol dehydrogenase family)
MQLEGRVAIVTGAGGGIGRAIALRFAREGAAVVVSGPRKENVESVTAEVWALPGRARAAIADVRDEGAVARMVEAAVAEFGTIDILVNNAGIAGPTAPVHELRSDDWDHVIGVNLTGAYLCAKHVVPHMIARRAGGIINITSIAGLIGYPLRSPYAASKWGMIGLTRTWALELGGHGITVNAIAPGSVRGARINRVIAARAAAQGLPEAEVEREFLRPTALKRMVEEDEIAAVAVFLVAETGRNITGETLNVSAGYQA